MKHCNKQLIKFHSKYTRESSGKYMVKILKKKRYGMAVVRLSSYMVRLFSNEGNVISLVKKVKLVVKFQDILDLILEEGTQAIYQEVSEEKQVDSRKSETRLKDS